MSLRAVSFDLDGTLYASGPFRRAYVRQNLVYLRTITTVRKVRESLRGLAFESGEAFFAEQNRLVGQRLGRSEEVVAAQSERLFSERVCKALLKVGPRPEVRGLVGRLHEAGLKIGVLSDFKVEDKLTALHLSDLPWGAMIASEAQGALKPHPRAFLALAERLEVPCEEIVHVGDRTDTDVAGAKAANMEGMLVSERPGERFADVVEAILARVH